MDSPSYEILIYDFDDDLIINALNFGKSGFRVFRWKNVSVVLGCGSKPENEINIENCIADKIPILRRSGGGCAVVLDTGNIIVSAVAAVEGIGGIKKYTRIFSEWLIGGLGRCGIDGAHAEGISDIAIGNRKVTGSSMQRKKGYFLYSASILVKPDLDLMESYLKHPPREPTYRMRRPHRDFIGSLYDLAEIRDIPDFKERLDRELRASFPTD